jgi:hypothetical protein
MREACTRRRWEESIYLLFWTTGEALLKFREPKFFPHPVTVINLTVWQNPVEFCLVDIALADTGQFV